MRGSHWQSSWAYSVRPDGSGWRRIAKAMYGVWAPANDQIAVVRVIRSGAHLQTALFLIWPKTGREKRLTFGPLAVSTPAWTADGRHIIFSRELQPNAGFLGYAPSAIWEIDLASGDERRLTSGPVLERSWLFLPAASRKTVVFSVIRPPISHEQSKPGADLYLITSSGRTRPLLTDGASDSVGPNAWSPDGTRLLFFRRGYGIFVFAFASRQISRLTFGPTDATPGWAPDGKRIVFSRGSDVYVMKADGSATTKIIAGVEGSQSGSWTAHGCS